MYDKSAIRHILFDKFNEFKDIDASAVGVDQKEVQLRGEGMIKPEFYYALHKEMGYVIGSMLEKAMPGVDSYDHRIHLLNPEEAWVDLVMGFMKNISTLKELTR